MLHINTLQGNLQEIYHAAKMSASHQIHLVANPFGTRLYYSSQGWGRMWRWFYMVAETFFNQRGLRISKIKKAVLYTYALFQKNLKLIQENSSCYQNYLIKTSQGYATNENELFLVRKNITLWNQATRPFVKAAINEQREIIEKLFRFCQIKPAEQNTPIFAYPQFEMLKQCQKIINLEGILNGALPLEIFEKISKNKRLSDSDFKDLDKWIKKLNQSSCSVRIVHQAIQAIIAIINSQNQENSDQADLIRLESMLDKRGCTLFQQDDAKFLQWRNTLAKGSKLILDGKEITLSDQLGRKILGNDRFLSFSIVEMPDFVVLTGNNEAILGLKKSQHLPENGYGVEPIQISEIYDRGRWTLVERLKPLNSYAWSSSNTLSNQDQFFSKPLVHLIKWLIQQKQTPDYFTPKYLMINPKQQLKSLRPTTKKEFDFNALEDFAFQCSSGNLTIFQHLMEASGLYNHLSTKFYHEVISNALKDDKSHPEDLAGIYNIDDPKVVDRAVKLAHDVLMLKQHCCFNILEKHPEKKVQQVEQSVNKAILRCHQENRSAGTLWPTLLESVLASTK